MSHGRYRRSMGRHWVPITMELIEDGIYDQAWFDRLETDGWAPVFGGVIVDTEHERFDSAWLKHGKEQLRPVHTLRLGPWRVNWRLGRYRFMWDWTPAAVTVVVPFGYLSVGRIVEGSQ